MNSVFYRFSCLDIVTPVCVHEKKLLLTCVGSRQTILQCPKIAVKRGTKIKACLCDMRSYIYISVNIGTYNRVLPNGTKPLHALLNIIATIVSLHVHMKIRAT